jgi:hypothetical protein
MLTKVFGKGVCICSEEIRGKGEGVKEMENLVFISSPNPSLQAINTAQQSWAHP